MRQVGIYLDKIFVHTSYISNSIFKIKKNNELLIIFIVEVVLTIAEINYA